MTTKKKSRGEAILQIVRILHPSVKTETEALKKLAEMIEKSLSFVQQIRAGSRDLSLADAEKVAEMLKKQNSDIADFVDPKVLCRAGSKRKRKTKAKTKVAASPSIEATQESNPRAATKVNLKKRTPVKQVSRDSEVRISKIVDTVPPVSRKPVAFITAKVDFAGGEYLGILVPLDSNLQQSVDSSGRLVVLVS